MKKHPGSSPYRTQLKLSKLGFVATNNEDQHRTPTMLRFSDLKARGIVENWVTLGEWIEREGRQEGCSAPTLVHGPTTRLRSG